MSTEGVLYIAFGWPYLMMAIHSARTFRATNPGRGITILSDVALDPTVAFSDYRPNMDRWIVIQADPAKNRLYKTSANLHSPYERTLLLDSDTVVLGDLSVPFRLLDFADILVKLDPKGQNRPWQRDEPVLDVGRMADLPSWNGGVVFFRRGAGSESFFKRWQEGFVARNSPFDQPALSEAILSAHVRLLPLDERWNCPTGRFYRSGGTHGPVQILHYMSRAPEHVVRDIRRCSAELSAGHEAEHRGLSEWMKARTEGARGAARGRNLPAPWWRRSALRARGGRSS